MMDFYYWIGCRCSKASACLLVTLCGEQHEYRAAERMPEVVGYFDHKKGDVV